VGALMLSLLTTLGVARAQDIDAAFSDEVIRTFGLPETEIMVSPDGVTAPDELPAGFRLITLNAVEPYVGYVNIVQYPAELDEATATEQMLAAGAGDMPQEGWTYYGGSNTGNVGEPVSFAINLAPGEYHWGVSYYSADNNGEDEIITLVPFTVSEDTASVTEEPASTVLLEETDDLRYIVSPEVVPAGPQVWKIDNVGSHHVHHVVMVRVPDGTRSQTIVSEFNAMFNGTPTAGEPVMAQAAWVGYAAIQSGGQTTWSEFNLDPATYAVICFIMDPATSRPHVLDGMTTVFTVE
jgi:hypothetical protein